MPANGIVEALDVIKHLGPDFIAWPKDFAWLGMRAKMASISQEKSLSVNCISSSNPNRLPISAYREVAVLAASGERYRFLAGRSWK